jgi:peptidoglycan/LPS O-acetylase OafA/YrhL
MNRIFRIYPAFIVALIINTVFFIRNGLKSSPLDALWDTFGFRGIKFWEELILLRGRQNYLALDWTLTIEIVMSFFIPYLIAMTLQNKKLLLWFTFTTFLMGFIIGKFVMPFALGMLLSQYFYKIQAEEFKQTKWYRYRALFLALAFILFSLRHLDKIVPFGERVNYWMEFTQLEFFSCSAIGSFIFLVYIIHSSKAQRVLEHPILIFIGKISYGIYLMHWVFVAATFEYWSLVLSFFPNVATAFIAMFMICCALTLLSATALYYWVELPFIKKGKQITENWKPSVVIANKP